MLLLCCYCDSLVSYNSYFQSFICNHCNKRSYINKNNNYYTSSENEENEGEN